MSISPDMCVYSGDYSDLPFPGLHNSGNEERRRRGRGQGNLFACSSVGERKEEETEEIPHVCG